MTERTIEDLQTQVDASYAALRAAQDELVDALRNLARAAERDAAAAEMLPPEAMVYRYSTHVELVRVAREVVDTQRAALAACATELNRREGIIP